MKDRNALIVGGLIGAAVGAAAGYLFLTDAGRRRRADAQERLAVLLSEADRLLSAADQVRQSVAELRGRSNSGWPRSA